METAPGSRGYRKCCRAAEAIYQQILEKNGNREEWELEHWCETVNEMLKRSEMWLLGKTGKNRQREEFLLLQSNTKLPSLHGPMPVFSGTISGVRLIRNQSPPVRTALEHQISDEAEAQD